MKDNHPDHRGGGLNAFSKSRNVILTVFGETERPQHHTGGERGGGEESGSSDSHEGKNTLGVKGRAEDGQLDAGEGLQSCIIQTRY